MRASVLWRVNQVVTALAVLTLAASLAFLVVRWVGGATDGQADPHGYGLIFGFLRWIVVGYAVLLVVAGWAGRRASNRTAVQSQ